MTLDEKREFLQLRAVKIRLGVEVEDYNWKDLAHCFFEVPYEELKTYFHILPKRYFVDVIVKNNDSATAFDLILNEGGLFPSHRNKLITATTYDQKKFLLEVHTYWGSEHFAAFHLSKNPLFIVDALKNEKLSHYLPMCDRTLVYKSIMKTPGRLHIPAYDKFNDYHMPDDVFGACIAKSKQVIRFLTKAAEWRALEKGILMRR